MIGHATTRLNFTAKLAQALTRSLKFSTGRSCLVWVISMVLILPNLEMGPVRADDQLFDPMKQFTITDYGAILGDPAQFQDMTADMVGFTFVQSSLVSGQGLLLSLSMIYPAQNGKPGSGHAIMATPDEANAMVYILRNAHSWSKAPERKLSAGNEIVVGYVRGDEDADESVTVMFYAEEGENGMVQIEHMIAKRARKMRFSPDQANKFAAQILHFLEEADAVNQRQIPLGTLDKS